MVILDTDILVAFLRGQNDTIEKIREFYNDEKILSITSITAFELFKGTNSSSQLSKKIQEIELLLEDLDILYFDIKSSKIAGKIYSQLKKDGNMVDILDQLIAAIAIANNSQIITRNVKDFSKISNAVIEKW